MILFASQTGFEMQMKRNKTTNRLEGVADRRQILDRLVDDVGSDNSGETINERRNGDED